MRIKLSVHGDEGAIRRLRVQDDEAFRRVAGKALRHQAGAGTRIDQGIGKFVGVDEGQIGRAGQIGRRHAGNQMRHRRDCARFGAGQRDDFRRSSSPTGDQRSAGFPFPNPY